MCNTHNYLNNIDSYFMDTSKAFNINHYIYYRLKEEKGIEKSSWPLGVGLKISDKCNFNCSYCFTKKTNNFMSLNKIKHLTNALDQKPYQIYLTGGEPLLNPEFFEIVDHIHNLRIDTSIHTSGVIDDNLLSKMVSCANKLKRIQISIDSIKNFSDLRPTKIANPLKSIVNFIDVINNPDKIHVNCVVSSLNIECVKDIFSFCVDNNVKFLRLSTIFTTDEKLKVTDINVLPRVSEYIDMARKYNIVLTMNPLCHPWSLKTSLGFSENSQLYCPAQKTEIEVDVNGNVYPCPFLHDDVHCMGNIFEQKIGDIWESGVDELKKLSWSDNKRCKICINYETCGGGCYANAYVHAQNYDPRCCLT